MYFMLESFFRTTAGRMAVLQSEAILALTFLKSHTIRYFPSFFFRRKIGLLHGLLEGSITPDSKNLSMKCCIFSRSAGPVWYSWLETGS